MGATVVQRVWLPRAGVPVALHVLELGLACCGVEVREARRLITGPSGPADAPGGTTTAARCDVPVLQSDGDVADAGEPLLHVLVVAGTVTTQLAPVLAAALSDLPDPHRVLAFGACAATGGPYWDSYAVLPGAHEVVAVDAWVAGCPPRPADLLAGLEEVARAAL
jgi:NADH-quinone oxidoreductase subunit B